MWLKLLSSLLPTSHRFGCGLCCKGMTIMLATMGVLPGMAYLSIFTIPHSMWLEATLLPNDGVSKGWKQPGINFFNWLRNDTSLTVDSSRVEVTEAALSSVSHLLQSYGFGSGWYQRLSPICNLAIFSLDMVIFIGILFSLLLVISYFKLRRSPKQALCLSMPILIYNLILGLATGILLSMLIWQRPRKLIGHNASVYNWFTAVTATAAIFNLIGGVVVALYVKEVAQTLRQPLSNPERIVA